MQLFCGRVENIVGKGQNINNQNFSFSHNIFKMPPSQGHENAGLYGKGLNKVLPIKSLPKD